MKSENSSTPEEMPSTRADAWRRLWERILIPLTPSNEEQNNSHRTAKPVGDDQQQPQNETDNTERDANQ
jgi:hypothetical protein